MMELIVIFTVIVLGSILGIFYRKRQKLKVRKASLGYLFLLINSPKRNIKSRLKSSQTVQTGQANVPVTFPATFPVTFPTQTRNIPSINTPLSSYRNNHSSLVHRTPRVNAQFHSPFNFIPPVHTQISTINQVNQPQSYTQMSTINQHQSYTANPPKIFNNFNLPPPESSRKRLYIDSSDSNTLYTPKPISDTRPIKRIRQTQDSRLDIHQSDLQQMPPSTKKRVKKVLVRKIRPADPVITPKRKSTFKLDDEEEQELIMDGWVTRSSRLKRAKVHMATSTDDLAPLSPLLSSNLKRRVDDDSVFKKPLPIKKRTIESTPTNPNIKEDDIVDDDSAFKKPLPIKKRNIESIPTNPNLNKEEYIPTTSTPKKSESINSVRGRIKLKATPKQDRELMVRKTPKSLVKAELDDADIDERVIELLKGDVNFGDKIGGAEKKTPAGLEPVAKSDTQSFAFGAATSTVPGNNLFSSTGSTTTPVGASAEKKEIGSVAESEIGSVAESAAQPFSFGSTKPATGNDVLSSGGFSITPVAPSTEIESVETSSKSKPLFSFAQSTPIDVNKSESTLQKDGPKPFSFAKSGETSLDTSKPDLSVSVGNTVGSTSGISNPVFSFGKTATTAASVVSGTSTSSAPMFGSGISGPMFGNTASNSAASVTSSPMFGNTGSSSDTLDTTPMFGNTASTSDISVATAPSVTSAPMFGNTGSTSDTLSTTPMFGNTASTIDPSVATAPSVTSAPMFGNTGSTSDTLSTTPMFGNTASTSATLTTAPMFGSGTSTTAPMFGSGAATTAPMFGSAPSSTTAPMFGSGAATSAPLFGSGTSTATAPMFGSGPSTTAAAPMFESAPLVTTAPIFGNTSSTSAAITAPMFGNTASSTPSKTAPKFGNSTTTAPFGNTTTSTTPSATSTTTAAPSFGTTAPSFNASGSSFSFGNKSDSTTAQPFGFGQSAVNNGMNTSLPSSNGFSFGQTASTPSAFGQSNSTPSTAFGQSQPSASSSYGQSQPSTSFGSTSSSFGQSQNAFGQPNTTSFGQPQPPFGQNQTAPGLFGQSQSAFGQSMNPAGQAGNTNTSFGQPVNKTNNGFGEPAQATTGFAFGQANTTQTNSKPSAFQFGQGGQSSAPQQFAFGSATDTAPGSNSFSFGGSASTPVFGAGNAGGTNFNFNAGAAVEGRKVAQPKGRLRGGVRRR